MTPRTNMSARPSSLPCQPRHPAPQLQMRKVASRQRQLKPPMLLQSRNLCD
jgi:hypothetical protein